MPLQGDVATLPVRELLGLLARTRASGRLSASRGMEARRFHLHDGRVVLASSSEPEERLGKLLVDRGLLDEEQLARALKTRNDGSGRLGRTLSRAGLVPAAAVAEVLADKMQRLLIDFLAWTDGQFYFDPAAAVAADQAPPAGITTAIDLADLLRRQAEQANKTWVVSDSDVIEATPLHETPARRRKRSSAQA